MSGTIENPPLSSMSRVMVCAVDEFEFTVTFRLVRPRVRMLPMLLLATVMACFCLRSLLITVRPRVGAI